VAVSDTGIIAGESERYDETYYSRGLSVWLYDSQTTVDISRAAVPYVRDDDYRYSRVDAINASGQVAGWSRRYNNDGSAETGWTTWFYDGATHIDVGLYDAVHTRADGHQKSEITHLTDSGYVAGYSIRYSGSSSSRGETAWLFDGVNTVSLEPTFDAGSYASSKVLHLGEDGFVIGLFDSSQPSGGPDWELFAYHEGLGVFKLGLRVQEWEDCYPGGCDTYPGRALVVANDQGDAILEVLTDEGTVVTVSMQRIIAAVIDVIPASAANEVDPAADGAIPVNIYSKTVLDGDAIDFDARDINPATLKFGFGEAPTIFTPIYFDADGNGSVDAFFGFDIQASGIACGDTEIALSGETYSGLPFSGTDSLTTVECDSDGCHP
jgi:hypothetical protein